MEDNETTKLVFNSKETLFMKTIDNYFKLLDQNNIDKMISIINGESKISLRLLDWFITGYSKKYRVMYNLDNDNDFGKVQFNVHIEYKAQLKSFKKRYFDPFRRRKKFKYYYDKSDKNKYINTTIGQLNFFKWAFDNLIIDYVEKNYDTILGSMTKTNQIIKKKKSTSSAESAATTVSTTSTTSVQSKSKKVVKPIKYKINLDEESLTLSFE